MANKLLTSNFKLHQIRQLIESINEPANTIYYVFAGKPTQYTLGDNVIDAPNNNIEQLNTKVYDEMVLAKKIEFNDMLPLIKRYNWEPNVVYDMYDSLDINLENKSFFVITKDGDTYYVFKCLYNNKGALSTSPPIYTSPGDSYYETSDGYVWKYMYQLNTSTFNKFATNDFIPVIPDPDVVGASINGEIDIIDVVLGGRDYNNYLIGTFNTTSANSETVSDVRLNSSDQIYRLSSPFASNISDYYTGCYIKIVGGDADGEYRRITSYDAQTRLITIDRAFLTNFESASYEIFPRVIINHDGRQTIDVEARALVNSAASNSIYKIDVLNKGKDVYLASAIVDAHAVVRPTVTSNAELRIIYPPKGGHGNDPEAELFATRLGISVKFSNNENGEISTDNDFRTIGIIKDPKFNNIQLNYIANTQFGGFRDTEEIVQAKLNRIHGTVGVRSDSKDIISIGTLNSIIVNANGYINLYNNTDVITVSNVVVNAIANVVTNVDGSLDSSHLTYPGYGISDESIAVIFCSNSSQGNIRYFNSKIITGFTATANGKSYSNDDVIAISTANAGINAAATIITNGDGVITQISLTNSGKGFSQNEIGDINILNGGSGYANGSAVTFNGPGGATATIRTNGSGSITSFIFTNRGLGYITPPSITSIAGPGGGGSFTCILKSYLSSYKIVNASGGYSNGANVRSVYVNANGDIGLYANTDTIVIVSPTDSQGNAIANAVTNSDGSLNDVIVGAGGNYGFSIGNTELEYYVANSTGGFLRRFDNKIISDITVANSSPAYRVNSISIVANGQNYNSTKVLRVDIKDGGIGYNSSANNILLFTPVSGGTGANAYFSNDDVGKIISVTMIANGTGYVAPPTVSLYNQSNGIGANLTAILANSITFSSSVGGYGAIAYFSNNASGNLTSITIANAGFGYTSAPTVTISDPIGSGAVLTASINGLANCFITNDLFVGFGGIANAQGNVTANALYFMTDIIITDSGSGFNYSNLQIKIANSIGGNIRYLNDTIIKNISITTSGFADSFANDDILYVTNGSINCVANVITDSSGYLTNINVNVSGKGFINTSAIDIFVTNAIGNNIRYLNTNVVSDMIISDGGLGYNNTDYIVISSPGSTPARANIETNSLGTIVSYNISDHGKNLIPWSISSLEIVSGGTGYANADAITFCGGGGEGANAVLMTNSTGGIDKVYITNGGSNFDCAPTIEITTAGGANANIKAIVNRPTTLRIYDQNGNPSGGNFADISPVIKQTPTVDINLIRAPTIGNTAEIVTLSIPANIEINLQESANLYFVAQQAADLNLNIADNRTTFDSSIYAGDLIYLQTQTEAQLMTVEEVANSTWLTVTEYPSFTNNQTAISLARINARGNVKDQTAVQSGEGYVRVTNVNGLFVQSNDIIGIASRSYINVSSIAYGETNKTGTNINQLFTYYITAGDPSLFHEDEILESGIDNKAHAYFHSSNSSAIRIVNPDGLFYAANTVVGKTSGNEVTLATGDVYKYEGDITRGSGDIIYLENIEPIPRSNNQSETIKIILEF